MIKLLTQEEWNDFDVEHGIKAPEKGGTMSELGSGIVHGALQSASGMASTAKEMGWIDQSTERSVNAFVGSHQQFSPPEGYTPTDFSLSGLARTVGQGVGSTAAPIVAAVVGTTATGNPLVGAAASGAIAWGQIYGDEVKDMRKLTRMKVQQRCLVVYLH